MHELNFAELIQQLPPRATTAHKGNFGHVLVIGGDDGYAGAPVMAALGALRVGAGMVTIASHAHNFIGLNAAHPEIMTFAIDKPSALKNILPHVTVVVLGPGLGRETWSKQVYKNAEKCSLPMVIDADGLYFLSSKPIKNANYVLTPHPGEAATLLGQKQPIANTARLNAIQDLVQEYAATVVLKGSGTLVGSPDADIGICTAGNPGMATAGMGDLLSGIIAGLIAQGLDVPVATQLGVCVHAMAGDIAAKSGQRGLITTDLLLPLKLLMG